MKIWSGDVPIERDRDLLKDLDHSDVLDREDQEAVMRLYSHIMINGMKLSDKEEYEWRSCGILKDIYHQGRERLCIDLFWISDDEEDGGHDSDPQWLLALMLKKRTLRCVPGSEKDEFVFFTNESYEDYLKSSEEAKRR